MAAAAVAAGAAASGARYVDARPLMGGGRLPSRVGSPKNECCDSCRRSPKWQQRALVVGAALVVTGVAVWIGVVVAQSGGSGGGGGGGAYRAPIVINTWFPDAAAVAYGVAAAGYEAMDAVQAGCAFCEAAQCDTSVGWGNHPDTTGEVTLDAIIMDGVTMNVGSVAYLRNVSAAIASARQVMHYSTHTVLAGSGATAFSVMMGQNATSLSGPASDAEYASWLNASCQHNYFVNVVAGNTSCPPYVPIPTPTPTPVAPPVVPGLVGGDGRVRARATPKPASVHVSRDNHDTIGMCVMDGNRNLAGGGSSNGANHKIAGRVGDVPIPGAAVYADNAAGCAAATGDGDLTMRFLPAYQAVEFMRGGMAAGAACEAAVRRIMVHYGTSFHIGLVCLDTAGNVGAAAQGWVFTYGVASPSLNGSEPRQVQPLKP